MRFLEREKRLIILDVDGVILDIRQFEFHFVDVAREHYLPVDKFLKYWKQVEEGRAKPWPDLASAMKAFWDIEDPVVVRSFLRGLLEKEKEDPYPPIWGSLEAIAGFRRHGLGVALCTSRPVWALGRVLEWIGMKRSDFAAASTRECGYSKPDPRMFDPIFQAVQIPGEQVLYVGDFEDDLVAAREARVDFAAVLSGLVPAQCFAAAGLPEQCIFDNLLQVYRTMAEPSLL